MKTLPDYKVVYELLQRSQSGIRFSDFSLSARIYDMMQKSDHITGINCIILLFDILDELSRCTMYKLLSTTAYSVYNNGNVQAQGPVDRVYDYLYNHFKEKVSLHVLAHYVKFNPTALCRYFKQHTNKTIFECLAEIRIEHTCHLLTYSDMTISEIAYESGYNQISLFNKQFYIIMHMTPTEYRKQMR